VKDEFRHRWAVAIPLFFLIASACGGKDKKAAVTPGSDSTAAGLTAGKECPAGNPGLTLPDGFCAVVFADSIGHARDIVVASNGDVYVTLEGTDPNAKSGATPKASFVALRDTTHDGRADIVQRVGTIGNTGIGIFSGHLYVDEGERIVRYARADSQLVPTGREVVVQGLPLNPGHRARSFAFGADGSMYVNVGSSTNNCQKKDRALESPGIDPCTELSRRAGTWKFDASKTNQSLSPAARFATGIRNGMGLAVASDGKLYATQHGRDQIHDNWPKIFPSTEYQAENPGEELIQVNQGDDFGWPYCYYAMDQKKLVDAPEYGGDGTKATRCADKKAPVAVFPGHWAPMALLFYTGSTFPERYRNGAFISFHGSWNRSPSPQAGYRVVFQPLTNGAESAPYETFADGFAGMSPDSIQPNLAKHRPVGLATGPDGALYIADDAGGRIYRITYTTR
jgi:glucose/arabinose dehydrogenase